MRRHSGIDEAGELLDSLHGENMFAVMVTEPIEPRLCLNDVALVKRSPGAAYKAGRIYYIQVDGRPYLRKCRKVCEEPGRVHHYEFHNDGQGTTFVIYQRRWDSTVLGYVDGIFRKL